MRMEPGARRMTPGERIHYMGVPMQTGIVSNEKDAKGMSQKQVLQETISAGDDWWAGDTIDLSGAALSPVQFFLSAIFSFPLPALGVDCMSATLVRDRCESGADTLVVCTDLFSLFLLCTRARARALSLSQFHMRSARVRERARERERKRRHTTNCSQSHARACRRPKRPCRRLGNGDDDKRPKRVSQQADGSRLVAAPEEGGGGGGGGGRMGNEE